MAANAKRSEHDSAATVVGSDRTLALNLEMESWKVKSCVRVHQVGGAWQRIYSTMRIIIPDLVPWLGSAVTSTGGCYDGAGGCSCATSTTTRLATRRGSILPRSPAHLHCHSGLLVCLVWVGEVRVALCELRR